MDIQAALLGAILMIAVILFALLVERLNPVEALSLRAVCFNLVYTLAYILAQTAIIPIVSSATVIAINAGGGGLIVLPDNGWPLFFGAFAYVLTLDFMEYVFHRAQHRFSPMWAMHSFHHSDAMLSATTTERHYWAEHAIKMCTVYLFTGLLFKANPTVLSIYFLVSFYNVFLHMNIRIGFGKWTILINSPQYHRIHHSALPEHYDCNFAALFPLFDVMFGTYRQPRPAEFPPTGIENGDLPSSLADVALWPIRDHLR